ncbi:MAG: hypothetical protein GDA49_00435 [Rhodospirillales bacterium]|nr:hypothetical protein [Rhodospirillales bacterium]
MGYPVDEDHDRDIVGNLRVYADFGAGRVTTAVNGFRHFIVSNPKRPVGGLPMNGALTGRGTIDETTISSTLDGTIYVPKGSGKTGIYEVVIDADMAGKVYDHRGRLLVRGGVTGTHKNGWNRPGSAKFDGWRRLPSDIEDGEFFAIQTGIKKPVSVVRFGTPPPPTIAFPSYGSPPPSDFSRFARERDNLALIGAAMDAGHLAAPDALPDGKGTLTGYVKVDNLYSVPIGFAYRYGGTPYKGVGSLTIDADFGAGTVTTMASQFVRESNGWGIPGTLEGRGTIDRTTINSTLDGYLDLGAHSHHYDADLAGKVYDDNGTLLVHGALTGTVESRRRGGGEYLVSDIEGGEFYAVQNDVQ